VRASRSTWAGIDVGAGKGFDVAVIDEDGLVAGPVRLSEIPEVIRWLREQLPRVVAVDSPRSAAPDGALSRRCERDLVRARVCGIRYTPNDAALKRNKPYYAWIANGFDLYGALLASGESMGWKVIECFATATWSRLAGPKGRRSRATWSRAALDGLGLHGLPGRMSQDARDAIGAAVTAYLHDKNETEPFGDIIVPLDPRRRGSFSP
jgi:predicted nuclease with RNAse H fold